MSFGEFIKLQGLFRNTRKKQVYKVPKHFRIQCDLAWKKEASGRGKDHLAKADPEGGPPQADRSMVGPTRPPPPALLLECSSAAYEKQSKLYIRSV
jgi:hypothetical protein